MSTNTDNAPLPASTGLPPLPHMSDRRFIFLLPSTRKGLGLGSENSNHLGKRVITEGSIMENMRLLQPRRNAAALRGASPVSEDLKEEAWLSWGEQWDLQCLQSSLPTPF